MQHAPAELLQQRPRTCGVGHVCAHQAQQLAGARWRRAATDRTLDQGGTLGADLVRERGRGLGRHRAHLDEQLALHFA
jgi:hypothetical protein